jgi:hypothetical protein
MKQAIRNHCKLAVPPVPPPGWTGWNVHDWCTKTKGVEDRLKYVAWDGDVIAGFLFLRPGFPSAVDPGRSLLYVEDLAAAPGNLRTDLWCRPLKYVGLALLAFAAVQSQERGFDGNLGLHAADTDALGWYDDLNAKRGGRLFRPPVNGINAPQPIGADAADKLFFETYTDGIAELAREYYNA